MAKVLVFLADGFEDCEALCVIDVLRRAGIETVVAGVGKKSIVSSHNVTFQADCVLEELPETVWDCVFCPGGMPGATNLASSEVVLSYVKKNHKEGRWVSAICASPAVVFGKADILKGHEATCYPGCEEYAPAFSFSKDGVVVSGNMVTGKSAGWAFDLGLKLISLLDSPEKAEKVRASIYYKD